MQVCICVCKAACVGLCVRILACVVDVGCHLLSMSAANALFVHPFVRVYKQSVLQVCMCVCV